MIISELGSPPEALFASFDETPVASASLAQVHRATAADGRALAVKVQHPGLGDACGADAAAVSIAAWAAARVFPEFRLKVTRAPPPTRHPYPHPYPAPCPPPYPAP